MASASIDAASRTDTGSLTLGMRAWPDCMAALLAIARQRSVLAAAFFPSSFTTERLQDRGTKAATPTSVAWRMTVSILSPLASPCRRITWGPASSASAWRAMDTSGSASEKSTISHSK